MHHAGDSRPSVAIIGAGWAGLACALKLARAGYQPTIFESAPEPGGRARRAKLDDTYRDNGQHLLLAGCSALTQLCRDIGIDLPSTPFAYTDGVRTLSLANQQGRSGLVLALLRAQGLSWPERWALIRALFRLQLRGWQTPQTQTVSQWLQAQHQPRALIDAFWAPLALAILNTPIEQASMARLAPVLRDTLGRGSDALMILQPPADLSISMVQPMVNTITSLGGQLRCSQRITRIAPTPDGRFALAHQHDDASPGFHHVVMAIPPWALPHLALPFDTTTLTERFGAQPIATVYLGFDQSLRLPTPLVQLAGPTANDARIWAMDRAHCGEPGVIAISLSAQGAWTALDHETLADRCLAHLQRSLGRPLKCQWRKVVMVHRATPAAAKSAWLSASERRPLANVWLAGDWTHPEYPATLEAAMASGFTTAQEIIAADA